MKLAELIHNNNFHDVATATLATLATDERETGVMVAKVATVAVANPKNQKTQFPAFCRKQSTRPEWIALVCACRFNNCTMLGHRKPLECHWSEEVQ